MKTKENSSEETSNITDKDMKEVNDQNKPQNLTCCILMLDILLKQVNNKKYLTLIIYL